MMLRERERQRQRERGRAPPTHQLPRVTHRGCVLLSVVRGFGRGGGEGEAGVWPGGGGSESIK